MEETLIEYETAVLAKEKGFDIECKNAFYITGGNSTDDPLVIQTYKDEPDFYFRPTQSLLQKWLRDKHGIDAEAFVFLAHISAFEKVKKYGAMVDHEHIDTKDTYEEALEAGLKQALTLID